MDGSPSSIIMFGLGNGTFNGSPSLLITRGLGVGEEVAVPDPPSINKTFSITRTVNETFATR